MEKKLPPGTMIGSPAPPSDKAKSPTRRIQYVAGDPKSQATLKKYLAQGASLTIYPGGAYDAPITRRKKSDQTSRLYPHEV